MAGCSPSIRTTRTPYVATSPTVSTGTGTTSRVVSGGSVGRFASLEALRSHRDAQELERTLFGSDYRDHDLVFCHEDGRPLDPTRISERFAKLVAEAGLPKLRLHDARHTAATLALSAGVPAKVVSERLGHSGVAITLDLYSHVTSELEQQAADTLGAAVFGDS